jgi:vacuolar protein sorting-associated protein 26
LFGLSTPVDIDISFSGEEHRKHVDVKVDKDHRESMPLYLDGEGIQGKVSATLLSWALLAETGMPRVPNGQHH